MFTKWNKICFIGFIGIISVVITACSNVKDGGDGFLPFTSIVPGMSIEEMRELEPGITEEEDGYVLTKDYQGFPMEAYIVPKKMDSVISWSCDDDELDMDKLVDSLTDYFDKRYETYTTMEEDDFSASAWRTDQYVILLQDSVFEFMGTESREITLFLTVRLDLRDSTE